MQQELDRQRSAFWMERLRLFIFLSATLLILAFVSMGSIDYPLSQWAVTHSSTFLGNLLHTVFAPFAYFGLLYVNLAIIFVIFLFRHTKWNDLLQIVMSLFLTDVAVFIFKSLIVRFRPRLFFGNDFSGPNDTIWQTFGNTGCSEGLGSKEILGDFVREGMSFPSGHSAAVVAMTLAMTFLFPKFKHIFILIAILTMLQRVICGAHFASDTLTGAALALLVSLFFLPILSPELKENGKIS